MLMVEAGRPEQYQVGEVRMRRGKKEGERCAVLACMGWGGCNFLAIVVVSGGCWGLESCASRVWCLGGGRWVMEVGSSRVKS